MESKYGTSYNAYLVTGEKNVLIETVHADYFEEYLDNIRQVLPLEQVDYLIMNHNEPDHSGSVAKLLELAPNLTIFCTAAGKKHLEDITNRAFPVQVVKAGGQTGPGRRPGAGVHPRPPCSTGPDSMFTWDAADKVAFTCDFLGCHFCEPTMLDRNIHDKSAYEGERAYYYQGHFWALQILCAGGAGQAARRGGDGLSQPRPRAHGNPGRVPGALPELEHPPLPGKRSWPR